jgi:hypothetical protein
MLPSRKPFVVGHRNRRGTMVLLLRRPGQPLILGPWTLTAVVSAN